MGLGVSCELFREAVACPRSDHSSHGQILLLWSCCLDQNSGKRPGKGRIWMGSEVHAWSSILVAAPRQGYRGCSGFQPPPPLPPPPGALELIPSLFPAGLWDLPPSPLLGVPLAGAQHLFPFRAPHPPHSPKILDNGAGDDLGSLRMGGAVTAPHRMDGRGAGRRFSGLCLVLGDF